MTQDQPNHLDSLEAALGRFAELTMQNVVRHDEAIARHRDPVDYPKQAGFNINTAGGQYPYAIAGSTEQGTDTDNYGSYGNAYAAPFLVTLSESHLQPAVLQYGYLWVSFIPRFISQL